MDGSGETSPKMMGVEGTGSLYGQIPWDNAIFERIDGPLRSLLKWMYDI